MPLGPRDGTDARLHDDEGVRRIGEAIMLGHDTELQLQSDGHAGLSMRVDGRRDVPRRIDGRSPRDGWQVRGLYAGTCPTDVDPQLVDAQAARRGGKGRHQG